MDNLNISYQDTGYYSKIILDYIARKDSVSKFYNRFPTLENFKDQIKEKKQFYTKTHREVLANALTKQHKGLETSNAVKSNIESLAKENTFTITTGHQLNLFSGPLYFLYKIISVLNLCKELKKNYPDYNFVPVYWMASEDHDFEEIQYFNFKKNKITWEREAAGPVGRLSTDGLDEVFEQFSTKLNSGKNADQLRNLFNNAYLNHSDLSSASRYLVNALFKDDGLVVVDGDDIDLKAVFKPYAKQELEYQYTYKNVLQTNKDLTNNGYHVQVNPREVNLFYIGEKFRERIIKENNKFKVNNTSLLFDASKDLFNKASEKEFISGNALLRPLYQEVVLPNLCYIGGGGELAYWFQLKSTFNAFKVPFPILLMRNSALLVSQKQEKKLKNLNLNFHDLFLKENVLSTKIVKQKSNIEFEFSSRKKYLKNTFKELEQLAVLTDKSFIGAVKAQKVKQMKGLDHLEKRLIKAEKKKFNDFVVRTMLIKQELFPEDSLQERKMNFSEFYEVYGSDLLKILKNNLDPLDFSFSLITID